MHFSAEFYETLLTPSVTSKPRNSVSLVARCRGPGASTWREDRKEAGTVVKRWVRYVMPIMIEVDGETDDVDRVVMLPQAIRGDLVDARPDRRHCRSPGHQCQHDLGLRPALLVGLARTNNLDPEASPPPIWPGFSFSTALSWPQAGGEGSLCRRSGPEFELGSRLVLLDVLPECWGRVEAVFSVVVAAALWWLLLVVCACGVPRPRPARLLWPVERPGLAQCLPSTPATVCLGTCWVAPAVPPSLPAFSRQTDSRCRSSTAAVESTGSVKRTLIAADRLPSVMWPPIPSTPSQPSQHSPSSQSLSLRLD